MLGGICLGNCYRGRLRSGADEKLAVVPGSRNRVARGAAESAGEPGQVPAAEGHGDGALHCRDQPVHEQPGGEDADQEGYHADQLTPGRRLVPTPSNSLRGRRASAS